MGRYIKINKPRESRKAVLVGKINCLNALKRLAVFGELSESIDKNFAEMNSELANIPNTVGDILKSFPVVEVKTIRLEESGSIKCSYCGKFFSTQKGLAMHIKRAHPIESAGKEQSSSELDQIESQIAALEQEVSSI